MGPSSAQIVLSEAENPSRSSARTVPSASRATTSPARSQRSIALALPGGSGKSTSRRPLLSVSLLWRRAGGGGAGTARHDNAESAAPPSAQRQRLAGAEVEQGRALDVAPLQLGGLAPAAQ